MSGFIPPPMPAEPWRTSGPVARDTPCRKCGYNLRGLEVQGRCPECRSPIGLSVRGDLLRFSDPQWVIKLARGVKLIIASVVVGILGTLAVVLIIFALGLRAALLGSVIMIAAFVLNLIGSWLLTESDPSGVGEDQYGRSRKLIRFTLIVGVISTVLRLGESAMPMPPPVHEGLVIAQILAGLIGAIGWIALIHYLGKLAQRIPEKKLAKRADFLKFTLGGSYLLILLLNFIGGALARSMGAISVAMALSGFSLLLMLAMLVFLLMYLRMLGRLGKCFKEQASLAEASWNGAEAAQTSV